MSPIEFAIFSYIVGFLLGFNPMLIGTFSTYLSSMLGRKYKYSRLNLAGFMFIGWLVILILLFSVWTEIILNALTNDYILASCIAFGVIAIGLGLSQIRRYFWPEPLIKPPQEITALLHDKTTKKDSSSNIFFVALICVIITVPTVGINIIMLSIDETILNQSSYWMVLFALGLVTPIYGVLALIGSGTKPSAVVYWREKNKASMRLYGGLATIFLAWVVLYLAISGDKIL